MARDPRVRRAQIAAGIILGVIVGTVHALVVHVTSRSREPATAVVLRPAPDVATSDHDRPR